MSRFVRHSATSPPAPGGTWWDALYYDPLPIGGVAVALLLGTYALLGLTPSIPLLLTGFCGVALVYGMDRGVVAAPEDAINHPSRRRWVRAHRWWLWGEGLVLLVAGAASFSLLTRETMLWAGGGILLAGLHLLPAGRRGRLLKALGLGKPLVVAGAWALGATVLPVIEAGQPITTEIVGLAGYRWVFILPNVLLADWGDREGDAATGLRPWTEAGTGRTLRMGATALLLAGVGLAVGLSWGTSPAWLLLVDGLGLVWMGGAVWGLEPERPSHRWLMDLVVAWPLVPALVNWGIG